MFDEKSHVYKHVKSVQALDLIERHVWCIRVWIFDLITENKKPLSVAKYLVENLLMSTVIIMIESIELISVENYIHD